MRAIIIVNNMDVDMAYVKNKKKANYFVNITDVQFQHVRNLKNMTKLVALITIVLQDSVIT
jgi:hypothetical protein